jgi:hypothetical protein
MRQPPLETAERMTQSHDNTQRVRVAFDGRLPYARWGTLFHVFRIEQPEVELEWVPAVLPARLGDRSWPARDVGLFLEPVADPAMSLLALDTSAMVVIVAAAAPGA